jgi:hypothetical protein
MDSKAGTSALASFISSHRLCTTNAIKHCHKYDMLKPIEIPTNFNIATGAMSSTTKNLFTHHESFEEDILVEWQDFVEVHFGPEDQILCSWLSDWFMNALSDELHDEVLQEFHGLSESKQGVATLIKLAVDKIQSNSHEAKRALSAIITKFSIADIKNEDVKQATSWLKSVVKALSGTDDIPQRALGYILDGMAKSSSSEFNSLCTMIKLASARLPAKTVDSEKTILDALDELNKHYRDQVHGQKWPKLSSVSSSPPSAYITSSSCPSSSAFITSPLRPSSSFQPNDVAAFIAHNPGFVQALLSSLNHSDRICYNCKKTLDTSHPTALTHLITTTLLVATPVNAHFETDPPIVALVVPSTTAHDLMHLSPTQRPSSFLPRVLQHLLLQNLSPTRTLKLMQPLSMMLLPLLTSAHFKLSFFVVTMTSCQKTRL